MTADNATVRTDGAIALVEHVTYTYPGRVQPALRDVSLQLSPAEVVLVLGGSGSGKSTLLRALNGLVPHFHGGTFSGRVQTGGHDTRTTQSRDLAAVAGLVFQDPENQAVMTTVEKEIAFGLENLGTDTGTVSRLVEEALISLGLSRLRRAELATLSGGELQKVALAAVLAMQPQMLLLDEPTSQLDPVSSEDLLATIRRLSEDTGATIVLAEHRIERCLFLATRVLYMEDGAIVVDSSPHEFSWWAAEHKTELLPPVTRLFVRAPGTPSAGSEQLPLTVKDARRALLERPNGASLVRAPGTPPGGERDGRQEGGERDGRPDGGERDGRGESGRPVIEVRRLVAGYPPDEPVLQGVDLALGAGEIAAVMGENGCGKSTLVRHFNGLARPLSGGVRLSGTDVASLSVAEAARRCAFLGQDPGAYFVKDSVAAELEYSLDILDVAADRRGELLHTIAANLDLEELMQRDPRELSGGERTRAALAIIACADPAAVVLDEPTRGMDPQHKSDLSRLLRRWADAGRCVVVVTHDVEFAARTSRRVIVLGDGGVLADGPTRNVLSGSLFFSTQIDRLARRLYPGALTEDDLTWDTAP